MKIGRSYLLLLIMIFASGTVARAQTAGSKSEDTELEALYDRFESDEVARENRVKQEREKKTEKTRSDEEAEKNISRISDLGELAPFEDIAVIQRRFLPRSQRFELSAMGLISTNNQFFNNLGIGLRGTYYFREKYAIEGIYQFLTSTERDITKGLKDNQNIATDSIVEPEGYMGVAFKWSPIYGKVALFQKKIIPFDVYFTPGIGMTKTALGENESTVSLGVGQLFALSKGTSVRWDLNWNFYNATVKFDDGTSATKAHNDLLLMVGYSFYFPEATYR